MTNLNDDLDIIQALEDLPNDTGSPPLSAAEFKAKFDEAGNIIKAFLNNTHIPETEAALSGKTNKPSGNGTAGQYLMTNGDGTTQWDTPTGAGDMAKSIYDTDNDGKVDSADSADTAVKVGHALSVGGKTYNGSAAVSVGGYDLVYQDNPITTEANDTPANWIALGPCYTYLNSSATQTKPSSTGHLINLPTNGGTVLNQLWLGNTNGVYFRIASGGSWVVSWTRLARIADVPTKTSELTNDSGFITSSGNAATATTATKVGHTLTFTGYQSATFNGSADKSVAIPKASSSTPVMNGTASAGSETTTWARGDHVHPTDTSRAPLASPTFTGTPKAPRAATGTNTTQIASTSFVQQELNNLNVPTKTSQLTNDAGFITSSGNAATATTATKVGHTLTFTGYQSKTFNGSAAVSVAIPSALTDLSGSLTGDKITSPAIGTLGARKIYCKTTSGAPSGSTGSVGDICIVY